MGERWLSVAEFGERIGVKKSAAYQIVASGEVAVTPIGNGPKRKTMRISERALEDYMRRKEIPART